MPQADTDDNVTQGKQKLQDLSHEAKEKARDAADTAKEKARETVDTTKEHPTRAGSIVAAVVAGLAAIWALRRKLRRRKAS